MKRVATLVCGLMLMISSPALAGVGQKGSAAVHQRAIKGGAAAQKGAIVRSAQKALGPAQKHVHGGVKGHAAGQKKTVVIRAHKGAPAVQRTVVIGAAQLAAESAFSFKSVSKKA